MLILHIQCLRYGPSRFPVDENQALHLERYPWEGEQSVVSEDSLVDFFPAILMVPIYRVPAVQNSQLGFQIYHQWYIGRADPSTIIELEISLLLWSKSAWRLGRAGGERRFSETEMVWRGAHEPNEV